MILSAISLWKKFNLNNPLGTSEWGIEEKAGKYHSQVSYSGHAVADGSVRIYARFARPAGTDKRPAVLLLPDAGERLDVELMDYFVDKGYAVLMPDYSGKMPDDKEGVFRTVYPPSLSYGNLPSARGLYDMEDLEADGTTWFEWTYVALYSIEYLKSRLDIGEIGIVGIRLGGELAWHAMLSPDVKCGIPINAVGWRSFQNVAKFGDNIAHNLSDDRHRYIAAVEAQSYAPYIKCPVLMLCALRDTSFDYDRAYDTFSRIGVEDGNALVYCSESGACIGPNGLTDMDLFLEKNLKGREIYIPDTSNISVKEVGEGLEVMVECDKEGILEELGIYYAEADPKTKPAFREWRRLFQTEGRAVKDGVAKYTIKPFAGTTAVYLYAYAKYINGFRGMSKVISKRITKPNPAAIKSRMLFSGKELDSFFVSEYDEYSIGGIFLERAALPKLSLGYGGISGAYSVGGIKTYKISSPEYIPDENALLKFDAYSHTTQTLRVCIEVADLEQGTEKYLCDVEIKGGGKWKRFVLKAADFKGETYGMPLHNFFEGSALSFDCGEEEEQEFAVTNILWL